MKDQLRRTQQALEAAKALGFDLVVIVTVVQHEEGLSFQCALGGMVPPSAAQNVASGLHQIAEAVEEGMRLQTEAWQSRGVS